MCSEDDKLTTLSDKDIIFKCDCASNSTLHTSSILYNRHLPALIYKWGTEGCRC